MTKPNDPTLDVLQAHARIERRRQSTRAVAIFAFLILFALAMIVLRMLMEAEIAGL